MIAFRGDHMKILASTDVASRGLDVSQVSHVINYDLPDEPRCTSTASAARPGRP